MSSSFDTIYSSPAPREDKETPHRTCTALYTSQAVRARAPDSEKRDRDEARRGDVSLESRVTRGGAKARVSEMWLVPKTLEVVLTFNCNINLPDCCLLSWRLISRQKKHTAIQHVKFILVTQGSGLKIQGPTSNANFHRGPRELMRRLETEYIGTHCEGARGPCPPISFSPLGTYLPSSRRW